MALEIGSLAFEARVVYDTVQYLTRILRRKAPLMGKRRRHTGVYNGRGVRIFSHRRLKRD